MARVERACACCLRQVLVRPGRAQDPNVFCSRACLALTKKQRWFAGARDRVMAKVDGAEGQYACWPWRGSRLPGGYGKAVIDGKHMTAHRAVWIVTQGDIPAGMFVCHRCDNPPCCNPAHLFLGTPADNTADMLAKDRAKKPLSSTTRKGRARAKRLAAMRLEGAQQP